MRHLLSLFELDRSGMDAIFQLTARLKARTHQGCREPLLPGHVIALLFEKPSLRTRVSFESAMAHLGGQCLFLGPDVGWGERESIADFSRVLSSYVDGIVCRARSHDRLLELANHAVCPVINGLTDQSHPCQALTDLFTLGELHGGFEHQKIAFVGDANNVASSLAVACGNLGVTFAIASPPAFRFDREWVARLYRHCPNLQLLETDDPVEAVRDATCVYTDVWASMGQESEAGHRERVFADYQVNARLMAHAPNQARFLHCLPARRGMEVTDEVIDGPWSAVLVQAENRMHVQKGLLAWLLDASPAACH